MSNLAQEEADRYFSHHEQPSSHHPEDRDQSSTHSSDDETSTSKKESYTQSDPGTDDDTLHNMGTLTTTKTTFHLPTTTHYANTGPKGVIADAQSFARAKQTTFRQRFASIANNFTSKPQRQPTSKKTRGKSPDSNSALDSDTALSEDDADSDFMNSWRATRIQELSSLSAGQSVPTRRVSPSRRIWGTLAEVDATGYLDAIEKVSPDTVVVVMIYDSSSNQSTEVEDELGMLAYKHSTTRFVKLHHEIAEMETVEIPAVLAYREGDVFATLSGAKAEGLEATLKRHRILQ